MAPLSFEGSWEMSSLSCALLNFSIKDGENGYWEKISSICHSGKVWGTQGLIMTEGKKELALLLYLLSAFLPAAQNSKEEMTRVTGNTIKTGVKDRGEGTE